MRRPANFSFGRAVHDPGPEFPAVVLGRRTLYLRRSVAHLSPMVFAELREFENSSHAGVGYRENGFVLKMNNGQDLFVRHARRGGLVRFFSRDLYLGLHPRPVTELALTVEAQQRGIAVAEPLGAMIEWIAPFVYRGFFLTRAIAGMTLWDFLRTDDDPYVRNHVVEMTREALDAMHQRGLLHADLNLHNLLIAKLHESFTPVILDLDKARLFATAVPVRMRRQNFARLRRSARKLDPGQRYVDDHTLERLTRL
jgi:lipopolysaccharide kinase (Kdo/WaaP) family protein